MAFGRETTAFEYCFHIIEREALPGQHPSEHGARGLIDLSQGIPNTLQVGGRTPEAVARWPAPFDKMPRATPIRHPNRGTTGRHRRVARGPESARPSRSNERWHGRAHRQTAAAAAPGDSRLVRDPVAIDAPRRQQ